MLAHVIGEDCNDDGFVVLTGKIVVIVGVAGNIVDFGLSVIIE